MTFWRILWGQRSFREVAGTAKRPVTLFSNFTWLLLPGIWNILNICNNQKYSVNRYFIINQHMRIGVAVTCKGLSLVLNLYCLPFHSWICYLNIGSQLHMATFAKTAENELLSLKECSLDGTWPHRREHSGVELCGYRNSHLGEQSPGTPKAWLDANTSGKHRLTPATRPLSQDWAKGSGGLRQQSELRVILWREGTFWSFTSAWETGGG